uniref:Gluzincin n=1 Tax=Rhipicephalus zambeziensis TaxID=60191 RepID=A0A224YEC7_9ACAR
MNFSQIALTIIYFLGSRTVAITADATDDSGSTSKEKGDFCSQWCSGLTTTGTIVSRTPGACKNFYRHVCKKQNVRTPAEENDPDEISRGEQSYLDKELMKKIKSLLELNQEGQEPDKSASGDSAEAVDIKDLAVRFYTTCIQADTSEQKENVKKAVQEMLEKFHLGDWPMITGTLQVKATEVLKNSGLRPVATISAVGIEENNQYELTMTIPHARFAPTPSILKSSNTNSNATVRYRRLIRGVLKLFLPEKQASHTESTQQDEANESSEEMLSDEAKKDDDLSNVVHDIIYVEGELAKITEKSRPSTESASISTWQKKLGEHFPLLTGLQTDFKKASLRLEPEYNLTLHRPEYFTALANFLRTVQPRKLYNYLGWFITRDVADGLTVDIRKKLQLFLHEASKPKIPVNLNGDNCVRKLIGAHGLMEKGITYLYLRTFFQRPNIPKVDKFAEHVRAKFSILIKENSWMEDETKNKMAEWMNKLNNHIGASEEYYEKSKVQNAYSYVPRLQTPSLPLYFFYFRENNFLQMLKLCYTPYDKHNIWAALPLDTFGRYSEFYKSIEIPAAVLQTPFFDVSAPDSHNFGPAGTLIADVLSLGMTEEGGVWNTILAGDYKWSEKTKNDFNQRVRECMRRQRANSDNQRRKFSSEDSIEAFQTLQKECRCPETEAVLAASKLFFTTYVKSQCDTESEQQEHRVNYLLSRYQEFGKVFRCTEEDPMKRSDTCKIVPQTLHADMASPKDT